jgi:ketosteroid isomerase-like protein
MKSYLTRENAMSVKLPRTIAAYLDAYNARDRKAALACFSEDAVVHDEVQDHRGKKALGEWISTTIEKYQSHFSPGKVEEGGKETIVAMTVSGSLDGSPLELAFHFTIKDEKIAGLNIM